MIVFNRSARFSHFPSSRFAEYGGANKDGTAKPVTYSEMWHRFAPGLNAIDDAEAEKIGLTKPNPLSRTLRVIASWRDLGEGDCVEAIRATGDLRILRWILDSAEVGDQARQAVRLAAELRIRAIESGKPHADVSPVSYADEDYDLQPLIEA